MVKGDHLKRIVFLTHEKPQGYRIQQYFPFLEAEGWDVQLLTSRTGFFTLVEEVRNARILYVQRLLFDPVKLRIIRNAAKRLVYDFDDAVMYGIRGASGSRGRKFKNMVRLADAVFCGNRFLLGEAQKHRTDSLFHVPTVVDTADYPLKTHTTTSRLVVGWMGSSSTLPYLTDIKDLFFAPELQDSVTFKVVADRAPEIEGAPIEFEAWGKETEKRSLLSFDVGIMPLRDDMWSRGKCGLKLIQYMASGIPSLTHPYGAAAEIIADGEDGLLRPDVTGWIEAIRMLATDPALRERLGINARTTVEKRYSLQRWGKEIAGIMDRL